MRAKSVFLMMWVAVAAMLVQTAPAALLYVSKGNPGANPPYGTPATAAADIQTAINYTVNGATIMVYAATYDVGGTLVLSCTNRVNINKTVSVRSVNNDPANTIIKGFWHPVTTNGPSAVRCVYMIGGSSLIGFTLTNGATVTTAFYSSNCGGGVYAAGASAIVSNCTIIGNAAYGDSGNGVGGGGACYGTYRNCRFIGNRVGNGRIIGGGAFDADLYNCLLTGNLAQEGGGAFRCRLYGCVVSNNTAIKMTGAYSLGGGISGWSVGMPCRAYNCTIVSNRADRGGGVGPFTVLTNCTVNLNRAPVTVGQTGYGGGLYQPMAVTACTIVSNTADNGSGGYQGNYTNCTFAYQALGLHGPARVFNSLFYGHSTAVNMVWLPGIIDNCTFVGNGTGIFDYWASGVMQIRNCISYSNTANWAWRSATMVFSNNCTTPAQGGWAVGNITSSPRLVSFGSGVGLTHVRGDYHLRTSSPCLNTGMNESWMIGRFDLDGNRRLDKAYGLVDMGCYELPLFLGTAVVIR